MGKFIQDGCMHPLAADPVKVVSPRGKLANRVFSYRLTIGLLFVALAVPFAKPGSLWGAQECLGWWVSLGLVAIGMALRFWAAGSAGTHTHSPQIEGPQLATSGPYGYVRNPIYLGSMILGLGMVGMIGDWRLLPLYVAAFALLYTVIIPAEERFLRGQFGLAYGKYCDAVPRLIPRLRPWRSAAATVFHWQAARGELRLLVVLAGIYGVMELGMWTRGSSRWGE
jgi:protein-S-isoprenylcysteine O-methyltransferase Ste14